MIGKVVKTATFLAVFGVTGVVVYAAARAYKSVQGIGDFDFDLEKDTMFKDVM